MRFSKLLRRLQRDQRGFAVPTAMLMTIAATGIVSVGVMTTVRTQSGTARDQGTKSALQVAEAGVSEALLHFNRSSSNPCVGLPAGSGWCGPVTGAFNGGTFAYYVLPIDGDGSPCPLPGQNQTAASQLEFVASGDLGDGVTRRVNVTACSSSGAGMFADATVKGKDEINLDSNAEIHTNTATNGDINLSSNAKLCGGATVGVGEQLNQNGNSQHTSDFNCTQPTTEVGQEELSLPSVNQGDAATNNQNGYFFAVNKVSGNKVDACWNGLKANGSTGSCGSRELKVDSNSSVTLQGGVYSFCKLTLRSNSSLFVAAGAEVWIYFDSPEACGLPDGAVQLEMTSNSRITSNSGGATKVNLLFVGSPDLSTTALLNSNTAVNGACEQNFVIYAPHTDVVLNSNSTYCGGLAAKTLHLDSNARVYTDSSVQDWQLPNTPPHYEVARFVECGGVATGVPNTGC